MKRVTAFVGSARKKHTYHAVRQFLDTVQSRDDVHTEVVMLSDYEVKTCRGCKACCDRGEEFCPLKDDRDTLIDKMIASDGVVFASPTYSFHVSAIMKTFLDRLGFAIHRPRFFGKAFTSIAVEAIYGGPKVVEYLNFVGDALGFNVVKGSCVMSLEPMTDRQRRANDRVLAAHGARFREALSRPAFPVPTLFHLMMFRMGRTKIGLMLDDTWRDHRYYRENGWFESDYFYPVRLGPLRKVVGHLFDRAAARSATR